jgi:pectinesterase
MKYVLIFSVLLFGGETGFSQQSDRVELRSGKKVVYAKFGDREVHLDWFRPANEETLPGIVLIHGGGWIGGKRGAFETTARDLAGAGYVVANIDYRLATEARFPGAVLDCKAAVRWMRANAESLGVDPERIAAIGGSAGGHLAAMVATTSDDPYFKDEANHPGESDAVHALVVMGAGVDQVARVKESASGSIKNCVIFFGGEYSEVPEIYAKGSPITHLSETTPPLLMIDGEKDRPGERYVEFRRKLDALGVTNEFRVIPGAGHGEWGKVAYRPAFVGAMTEFLDRVFRGGN